MQDMDFNSAEFYQMMRDECYERSLECLEHSDFIGEHQELPILAYCGANNITPDELNYSQQKRIFDASIDKLCYDAEFFAAQADELDKQAYIKSICELGLNNIPNIRDL